MMIGSLNDPLHVNYSTATADSIAKLVAMKYSLPLPLECRLLSRGFNDNFEVKAADNQRYVLRVSCLRSRGEADVESETEFLTYLDRVGVPVAVPIETTDGAYFTFGLLPEGPRSLVLFQYVEGRSPMTGVSADARAQGITLARIHAAADEFDGKATCRYRLDLDHLLHRQVAAVIGISGVPDEMRVDLMEIASRLATAVHALDGLTLTRCHGDCHGGNARISQRGALAGHAVFFDFDDGGIGYMAYDLAVYLWANTFSQYRGYDMWHAFVEGYRSVRSISRVDFDAVHLFAPIRHIWLMGEYANRISDWGAEAISIGRLRKHLAVVHNWERERLISYLFSARKDAHE